jgi:hypothetical protein
MSYDSTTGDVVLFSGESTPAGVGHPDLLSDTWLWNGASWKRSSSKTKPAPRSGGVSIDDPMLGGLLLLGGANGSGPLGGTWMWSQSGWSQLSTIGAMPALEGLVAAFSADTSKVLAFGGVGAGSTMVGDTFVLASSEQQSSGPGSETGSSPSAPAGSQAGSIPRTTTTISAPSSSITSNLSQGSSGGGPIIATLTTNASVVHAGTRVVVSGAGFRDGTTVEITFHSNPQLLKTVRADTAGRFTTSVVVPDKAGRGTHHFEATGLNPAGRLAELVAAVQIVGASSGPTPVETRAMVAVAIGIPVATWLAMSGYAWFRRKTQRPAGHPV